MPDPFAPDAAPGPLSRRAFLGRFAAFGAAAGVLAACGGGDAGRSVDGAAVVEAASCPGYDALTEQQLQLRSSLAYVDETATPAQHCANCRFFQQPTTSACGGCQILQGPVSPGGYCRSWAAAPV